ncbi:MAG: metallophosphoesterase [Candidatus Heimdallarchaeota archaeon]
MTYAVIFGDVHLDAKECLKEEFIEAVRSVGEQVDMIIMNGDFVDSYEEKGKKALQEFVEWSEREGLKEKIIFVTGGMGHEGNLLYDKPDIQIVPYVVLNTTEGRIVICHGHNIGLVKRFDEPWTEATNNLKKQLVIKGAEFLPKIKQTDKLIISHTHTPFYDMDNGVFATGSWKVKKELQENEGYIRRNIGVFILLDDEDRDDPIKLKRWFVHKK